MRVALVGCGVALPHHLLGLRAVREAQVVAVCDRDGAKARAAAAACPGASAYEGFAEMLRKETPEVVHVMTPPHTHATLGLAALDAGCHVLMEKPMALTVAECDALIAAAARAGRMLCMMHNHLFDPNVARFRDLAAVERVTGPLRLVKITYGLDAEKMRDEGHDDPKHWVHALPLGILSEYCPHQLYLALNWLGEARSASVEWVEQPGPLPVPQHTFHLRVVGRSAVAAITVIDQTRYGHFTIDLHGLDGVLHLNMMDLTALPEREPRLQRQLNRMIKSSWLGFRMVAANAANAARIAARRLKTRPGHRALVAAFYRALATGGPPPAPPEAGREVVRVHDLLVRNSRRHG